MTRNRAGTGSFRWRRRNLAKKLVCKSSERCTKSQVKWLLIYFKENCTRKLVPRTVRSTHRFYYSAACRLLDVELARYGPGEDVQCTRGDERAVAEGGGSRAVRHPPKGYREQASVHAHCARQRAHLTSAGSVAGCRHLPGGSPLTGSGRPRPFGPLATPGACRRGARHRRRSVPGAIFAGWPASCSGPPRRRPATAAAAAGARRPRSG